MESAPSSYAWVMVLLLLPCIVSSRLLDDDPADSPDSQLIGLDRRGLLGTNDRFVARHGLTSIQYQAEFNKWKSAYRLQVVSGCSVNGVATYAALWTQPAFSGAWAAKHGMTSKEYQTEATKWAGLKYRVVFVNGFTVSGVDYFNAYWEKYPSDSLFQYSRHDLSSSQYQTEFNTAIAAGYRPTWISGYGDSTRGSRFAVIFAKVANGPVAAFRHDLSSANYQKEFTSLGTQGYVLKLVNAYAIGANDFYVGIWEKTSSPAMEARHRMTPYQYQTTFDNMLGSGYVPTHISAYWWGGQAAYAAIWTLQRMQAKDVVAIDGFASAFMSKHNVPTMSVAVAKDGAVVYAKAWGSIDVPASANPAGPNTRFRLASLSKAVTAAAIYKLIDSKVLKLSDKVFGTGALLGTTYGNQPYGPYITDITVQHLLQHTAGNKQWNNDGDDGSGDPMFQQTGMSQKDLISWVLNDRTLTTVPGSAYSYSNFGYCILGRIIEAKTKQTYASWVKSNVLNAAGASGYAIAGDTLSARLSGEVEYTGNSAYGMKVARMDAHGGWVASALDVVKFMRVVDGFNKPADVISAAAFKNMSTGSMANPGYASGWQVNSAKNMFHSGSLPGTATYMVRTSSGYLWSILMNSKSDDSDFWSDLDGLGWKIVSIGGVQWPSIPPF